MSVIITAACLVTGFSYGVSQSNESSTPAYSSVSMRAPVAEPAEELFVGRDDPDAGHMGGAMNRFLHSFDEKFTNGAGPHISKMVEYLEVEDSVKRNMREVIEMVKDNMLNNPDVNYHAPDKAKDLDFKSPFFSFRGVTNLKGGTPLVFNNLDRTMDVSGRFQFSNQGHMMLLYVMFTVMNRDSFLRMDGDVFETEDDYNAFYEEGKVMVFDYVLAFAYAMEFLNADLNGGLESGDVDESVKREFGTFFLLAKTYYPRGFEGVSMGVNVNMEFLHAVAELLKSQGKKPTLFNIDSDGSRKVIEL